MQSVETPLQSINLYLGGHVVAVEGKEVAFFTGNDAFPRFAAAASEAEWHVRYGCSVVAPPEDSLLLSTFVYEEISSRCHFQLHGDDYYFSMLSSCDGHPLVVMRYRRGSTLVEATSVENPNALRFSLWFAVSMLSAPSQLTFVHSSTIVYQGSAVLFLGESGTGKSTHTRLWLNNIEGSRLLNDDSPMIEVRGIAGGLIQNNGFKEEETIMVHGSPWSGKTPCYVPRCFPLAAIVRLSQAPYNAIRRLSIPQALAALQPSLPPALVQDDYFADKIMDIISAVISAVPVYHLECLPDAAASRLSCETVFGKV